ncbi:MAG: signal peptidase I [Propionibacteriaceae bacterium]|nr:signal peptidase I [Propionibacteriaceae bacterium]
MSKNGTSWGSAILSGFITFAMLILLGLAVAMVVVPKVMGGMSLTVLTGSMEPGIHPGDVVVTKGIDKESAKDLQIGDVIVFLPYPDDPTLVTHRIMATSVSGEGYSFVTKGDNNNAYDPWNPVRDFQVRGEVLYVIPKIGWVKQALGPYGPWAIPGVGILVIGYAVVTYLSSFRRTRDEEDPDRVDPEGSADEPDEDDVLVAPRRAFIEESPL